MNRSLFTYALKNEEISPVIGTLNMFFRTLSQSVELTQTYSAANPLGVPEAQNLGSVASSPWREWVSTIST